MRRAAWLVVAFMGLPACTGGGTATSTSSLTAAPTAAQATPSVSAPASPASSASTASSPSRTDGTAAAATRADYLAKAKPICDKATSIIDALPEPGNNIGVKLKILDQRAAVLTETLDKLRGLTPTVKDTASVSFIVEHLTAVRDDTSGQAAALRAGDTVKAGQLEARFDGDENIAKNAANDFGLGDCGA
jgi:hypothetical protein